MAKRLTTIVPLSVFAATAILTGLFWSFAYRAELRQVENETQVTVEQVGLRIESWIQVRVKTIRHQAETVDPIADPHLDDFVSHVKAHIELTRGYQAINWVNADGIIETIVPKQGNEAALGRNLYEHPNPAVVDSIRKAADTHRAASTPATIELFQGGRGFALYWPVYGSQDELLGCVNGVFKIDDLVLSCLNENVVNPQRFRYRLSDADATTIYDSESGYPISSLPPFSSPHRSRATITVADRTWSLDLEPRPETLPGATFSGFDYIIPIGLILAGILAWMAYFIMRNNRLLRLTTKRYLDLYENAPVAYFSVDLNRRIARANRSACTMLGYSKEELLDRDVMDLYADSPSGKSRAADLFERGKQGKPVHGEELEMARADGSTIWIALSVTWVRDFKGQAAESRSTVMDITEKVHAREKQAALDEHLYHSRKMESLGILAGGIAHDFNNLLMSIMGHSELLRTQLVDEPTVQTYTKEIEIASRRAADLCRQMLTYAGHAPTELGSLNLNLVIEGMRLLIETQSRTTVSIAYELEKALPNTIADTSQVQQCILDLVINAVEALAGADGTVTISTATRNSDVPGPSETRILAANHGGPFAAIRVADSGSGVGAETLTRMFEPFFSTKFTGRGLGLSSVHGIVRRHDGAILARSQTNQGTYIEILFPVSDGTHS